MLFYAGSEAADFKKKFHHLLMTLSSSSNRSEKNLESYNLFFGGNSTNVPVATVLYQKKKKLVH